jgi:hypothetical protein
MSLTRVKSPVFSFKNKLKLDFVRQADKKARDVRVFEYFVEAIYNKYPYVSKEDILKICQESVYSLRDLLLLGNVVHLPPIFVRARLIFADIFSSLKMKRLYSCRILCNPSKKFKYNVEEFIKEELKDPDIFTKFIEAEDDF